jgi:hypothetical protein
VGIELIIDIDLTSDLDGAGATTGVREPSARTRAIGYRAKSDSSSRPEPENPVRDADCRPMP